MKKSIRNKIKIELHLGGTEFSQNSCRVLKSIWSGFSYFVDFFQKAVVHFLTIKDDYNDIAQSLKIVSKQ